MKPASKKTALEMKDTLRYKHMVARLKGLAPYKKGAALSKEIAKGTQWRIDAAMEAVAPQEWAQIDTAALLKQAATFGRLQTINNLADQLGFARGAAQADVSIQAAFNVAALHGNYKTADALAARGAKAGNYLADGTASATHTAVAESDIRKINYLLKQGESAGFLLHVAVDQNNMKVLRHLVEKKNADVNFTPRGSNESPIKLAIRKGFDEVKQYLQQHGALVPVAQPKPIPAITAEALKGTPYETKFDTSHLIVIKDAWDVPEVPAGLKAALKAVVTAENGLDFTLDNGHQLQWRKATATHKEFIGRQHNEQEFDTTDARATVAGAIGRGWKAMNVHGNQQQQEAMWIEAQRQGIAVANFEPADGSDIQKRWAAEQVVRAKPANTPPAPK